VTDETTHQALREMLGSYALGHLGDTDSDRLRAHLDGCPECRRELQEILPVAGQLGLVDVDQLDLPPVPPAWLGERIRDEIQRESSRPEAARSPARPGRPWLVAAALLVVLGVGGAVGGLVGRATAPEAAPVPTEPIPMAVTGSGVSVESAELVAHTWGVELRIVAEGFDDGQTFRAAFRTEDGALVPAGEFRGVGEREMTCFLQSSVLRDDVTEVVVTDARGRTVLSSSL
jgi:hypothetical protein